MMVLQHNSVGKYVNWQLITIIFLITTIHIKKPMNLQDVLFRGQYEEGCDLY